MRLAIGFLGECTYRNLIHCDINNTANHNDKIKKIPSVHEIILDENKSQCKTFGLRNKSSD